MSKLLIIENCNFKDYPTGGTLSFARQLLSELPEKKIALVGITTENLKIGHWTQLTINHKEYDFFPIVRITPIGKKPFIPLRIKSLIALLYYLKKIRRTHRDYTFTQTPQFMFALSFFKWASLCFCFAGLGNSVKLSRYQKLRFLGGIYEKTLVYFLNYKADCVLAAADSKAIEVFKQLNSKLFRKNITSFPTRFDNQIFHPQSKETVREKLKLPQDKTILVTTGRLCWVKGWDLLLEVILKRSKEAKDFILIFVGDGEDKNQIIEKYPKLYNTFFFITGFVDQRILADYINASDVFLLGSYMEGWSTSLVEALACGKPIVTTNVSSAEDLVLEGKTGYIVPTRDADLFNDYIDKALHLTEVEQLSVKLSNKFRKDNLRKDLIRNWPQVTNLLK